MIYMGAGTSGRLGVLDAVECPPTFGVPYGTVIGLVASGMAAFDRPGEDVEDSPEAGVRDLLAIDLKKEDILIGIAASGRTPYVLGGLEYARKLGCRTAAIVCNPNSPMAAAAELAIEAFPGPECVTGSTRLKAGTCQKLILNMISTAAMVSCGKVYGNLMVDVDPCNEKLVVRARKIVMEATGCEETVAAEALAQAGNHAKTAITMILADCTAEEARSRLARAGGFVREAIR
jgi:N-acetylmuramic acid 6-phosphate etherase